MEGRREEQQHLKEGAGVFCSSLETHTATLGDLMTMERTIVVCAVSTP